MYLLYVRYFMILPTTQANSDKTPHRIYTNEENKNPNQKLDKTLFTPENLVYFHHYK